MRRFSLFLGAALLGGLLLWSWQWALAARGEPTPAGTIPINDTAYWATAPTGPDFDGVSLIPFAAQNPGRETYAATQAANQRFLAGPLLDNIQVSRSGTFTYASHPLNDFSEVMLAIDPTDPDHLLGSSKFFYQPATYSFYTGVFESYDGGLSWSQLQPAGVETYSLTSDPVNTFDHTGNGYFTLLTRGPVGLDMLKKPAGGNWQPPVVVDRTTYTDKQWIIGDQDPQGVSPYAGNLYMSWTDVGAAILFARSTDGNQSWSPPLTIASGGDVQGSVPGVAPDGTVYVVYGRDIFYGTPGTLEIARSTNGGQSFSPAGVAANITAIPYFLPNSTFRSPASLPAFAVSPTNGNLYLAWADYRHGDADIYFSYSTDQGQTWSPAARLNDDPLANGIDQWQPQVAVADTGRVAVMWFDRRLNCPDLPWIPPGNVGRANYCIDTFMTRSFDDGQTWVPNIRASAQTWDWNLNMPITGSGDGFIGDYQGIAASSDYDFPFWNATANLGYNPNNYQQVFVARVPVDLPFIDLAASQKTVAPALVAPGGMLTYTLVLRNEGTGDAAGVLLTDTIPISTTYVAGSVSGGGVYDAGLQAITWGGTLPAGSAITITFQVTTAPGLPSGTPILNVMQVADGQGGQFTREASATVQVVTYWQLLPLLRWDS